MVADELFLTGAEIVVDRYCASNLSEPVYDVAPDKAGAASYKCPMYAHRIIISPKLDRRCTNRRDFKRYSSEKWIIREPLNRNGMEFA